MVFLPKHLSAFSHHSSKFPAFSKCYCTLCLYGINKLILVWDKAFEDELCSLSSALFAYEDDVPSLWRNELQIREQPCIDTNLWYLGFLCFCEQNSFVLSALNNSGHSVIATQRTRKSIASMYLLKQKG